MDRSTAILLLALGIPLAWVVLDGWHWIAVLLAAWVG